MYADLPLARPPLGLQRTRKEKDDQECLDNLIAVGLVAPDRHQRAKTRQHKNVEFKETGMRQHE